jgi:predicted component of type VI protein secretion system
VIQLTVLSGEMVGALWVARRFPVRIGRAAASDLRLEADGVWDQHLVLDLGREGFSLRVQPNALARVNGQPVAESRLRNGDTIELGGVRLQFWLSPVRQRSLWLQEALSWGAILAVSLGQIGLLYWIIR